MVMLLEERWVRAYKPAGLDCPDVSVNVWASEGCVHAGRSGRIGNGRWRVRIGRQRAAGKAPGRRATGGEGRGGQEIRNNGFEQKSVRKEASERNGDLGSRLHLRGKGTWAAGGI